MIFTKSTKSKFDLISLYHLYNSKKRNEIVYTLFLYFNVMQYSFFPPSLLFNFRYLVRFLLSIDVIHVVDVGRGHSRFHRMRRMRLVLDIAQYFGLFWLFNRKRMMNTTDDEKKKNCGRSSFSADPSAIKWKLNDLSNKNLHKVFSFHFVLLSTFNTSQHSTD